MRTQKGLSVVRVYGTMVGWKRLARRDRLNGKEDDMESWEKITQLVRADDRHGLDSFIESLTSRETARALSRLSEEVRNQLLVWLSPPEARRVLAYGPNTAGGLMTTEHLQFLESSSVSEIVEQLRANRDKYSDYQVQYVYVVSPKGELFGVVRLRDLLLADGDASIRSVMIPGPVAVDVGTTLNQLMEFFQNHSYLATPVLDGTRLVGVTRFRAAVQEAAKERANRFFLKVSGIVGGEELRSMPERVRSFRRLSWLSVNILLNVLAASVIAFYQDTLSAAIALAVFLPIISDMSGCSGNQAVAVSIRELTLGLVAPKELF